MKKKISRYHAFTIVELVIVIAVIAVLASVLVPTFSNIVEKASQSKALQEAKNAWVEVGYTYVYGYKGFAADCGSVNGWYYDYIDEVAKYEVDGKYTVTYDGNEFVVNDSDEDFWNWDAITTPTTKNEESSVGNFPFGLTITYYDTIYSRGFSWITKTLQSDSKAYVVESNLGKEANFSYASVCNATSTAFGTLTSYKAYFKSLSPSTTYSYKVGSEIGGWKYGVFRTASSDISSITAIQLSDAQTKDSTKLYAWENTMAQAVETAGHGLDFILYNGDQADANASYPTDFYARYGIARETIFTYVNSLPYLASSGNHEPANGKTYVHYNTNAIDFGVKGDEDDGYSASGAYYSYDYGFAHFVVLNSNDTGSAQTEWLKEDLASSQTASWIIVMIHAGPYATGDHLSGASKLITTYARIFAENNVDLVLQAHDHTYNKTLPYTWGKEKGYVSKTESQETIENYINYGVETIDYNGKSYDVNPNGTYYVTTGAAGHRVGEDGSTYVTNYENNAPYKLVCGSINVDSDYADIGDDASTNINAQMFGILNLTASTLTYDFYAVTGDDVQLYDSLNVMKTN